MNREDTIIEMLKKIQSDIESIKATQEKLLAEDEQIEVWADEYGNTLKIPSKNLMRTERETDRRKKRRFRSGK